MNSLRKFEISVWTLQDKFITVIESNFYKIRGKTQNAQMRLNIDGTQELTFTIPMKYSVNGALIINPIWQDTLNGNIVVNTRKIKVILNKGESTEEIHEFVIDKVVERHENDEMYCDVTCSGLAFYELGKIGYKISLASEDFYADDMAWFKRDEDNNGNLLFTEQPLANLQYWVDKFLTKLPNEDNIEANTDLDVNKWYYTLQMEWPHQFNYGPYSRDKHKIYEDTEDYIYNSSTQTVSYKEKARMIDLEESNIYNLTQDIAEVFEVYCKYVYLYDSNYHIRGRIVVFYNTFMIDENPLSITYKYQTDSITREIDSTDLVTKMYVKTVDEDDALISIIDVEDNPTGEDYILNFNYLHDIGNIDDEQYEYISTFEATIKNINNRLKPLSEKISDLEDKLIDLEAAKATAEDAITLDKERIAQTDATFNAITGNTGEITITSENPDSAVLLQDTDGTYHINIAKQGVKINTVKIYATIKPTTTGDERLENQISRFTPVYDDMGNLIQIKNIVKPSVSQTNIVYLTYKYEPKLWFDNVKRAWAHRLAKDTTDSEALGKKINTLNTDLTAAKVEYENLLAQKKDELEYFEQFMGTAIREGYWQPENYNDSGDSYVTEFTMNRGTTIEGGKSTYDYFVWDTDLIEGEQNISYETGVEQNVTYYKCIDLSSIWNDIRNKLNEMSFLFYDYNIGSTDDYKNLRNFSIGSQAIVSFIEYNDRIFPALLLIGGESFSNEIWSIIREKCFLGKYNAKVEDGTLVYTVTDKYTISSNMWINLNNYYKPIYPRVYIESLSMKNSEDQLALRLESKTLTNFDDYYITTRVKESPIRYYMDGNTRKYLSVASYAITIKKEALYSVLTVSSNNLVANEKLSILFTISNADTAIFNDAKGILEESSRPQVSYEFNYNIFRADTIMMPEKFLRYLVKLNDWELKFRDVKGYVSEINLSLDRPWEDTLEIKNYRTKFEDLFSTILAETQEMKRSEYLIDNVYYAFSANGDLQSATIQKSLLNKDLSFSFNNGKLTIDEKNGIWGISDSGVVAIRGGGIFTASEKDSTGAYIWNTGITPEGINASLITAGQLDTSKIKIYAGDRLRLQMNEEGLFAYKSFFEDFGVLYDSGFNSSTRSTIVNKMNAEGDVDPSQYVKFDENGLFLKAARGAYVLNTSKTDYKQITNVGPDGTLDRVAITWDGLTLRNYDNQVTFYVNPDSGNLFLSGTLDASRVGVLDSSSNWFSGNEAAAVSLKDYIDIEIDNNVDVEGNLEEIFEEAGSILKDASTSLSTLPAVTHEVLTGFANMIKDTQSTIFTSAERPTTFKPGDIWEPSSGTYNGNKYVATSFSSKSSVTTDNPLGGWTRVSDGSLASITGAGITIDSEAGTIDLKAGSKITLKAKSQLDLASGDILITGNNSVNIGSKWINIGSTGGINLINSAITTSTTTGSDGKVNNSGVTSAILIDNNGIDMYSSSINLMAQSDSTYAALKLDPATGVLIGSNKEIKLFSGNINGGAAVLINPNKILFGVSDEGSSTGTAIEMTKNYLIFAAGDTLNNLRTNNPSSTLAGVKITKDGIWLSNIAGSTSNLITMNYEGITIGTATQNNTGSFIKLSKDNLIIGSNSNMYINTANVGLDTTGGENDTVGFRLGSASSPYLKFVNGALYLSEGVQIGNSNLPDYIQSKVDTSAGVTQAYVDSIKEELQAQIDGEIDTWFYEYEPTLYNEPAVSWDTDNLKERHTGDVFYNTNTGYAYRWEKKNNVYGWGSIDDSAVVKALADANAAQETADRKIATFYHNGRPDINGKIDGNDLSIGDLWIDTNDNNKLYRWSGSSWVSIRDTSLDYLIDKVDGKTTTFYGDEPNNPDENDIWYDTANSKIKRWTGTTWLDITNDALKAALDAAADAQALADGKIVTIAQNDTPSGNTYTVGDLWIDTNDNNKLYRWNGSSWVILRDTTLDDQVNNVLPGLVQAAETKITNIVTGQTGITWNDGQLQGSSLNKNGLTLTGIDGAYFKVNSTQMGFVKTINNVETPLLYYENGNMMIKGIIIAEGFQVKKSNNTLVDFTQFIGSTGSSQAMTDLSNDLDNNSTISQKIQSKIDTKANEIRGGYNKTMADLQQEIVSGSVDVEALTNSILAKTSPKVTSGTVLPTSDYKRGDHFTNTATGDEYICTSVSEPLNPSVDWTKVTVPVISFAASSRFNVVASNNTSASIFSVSTNGIEIMTGKELSLLGGTLNLGGGTVNMTSGGIMNLAGADINITSSGDMTISGGGNLTIGAANENNTTALKIMSSGKIDIMSGGELTIASTSNTNTSSVVLNSSGISLTSGGDLTLTGSKLKLESNSTIDLTATGKILLGTTDNGISLSSTNGIAIKGTTINMDSTNFKVDSSATGTNNIFFVGNSAGSYIKYSATNGLEIRGKVTITSGTTIPTKTSDLTNDSGFQNALQVTTITNNAISTATISADQINGGILTLGGENNINGQLQIFDASNNKVGEWNKDGIKIIQGTLLGIGTISPSSSYTNSTIFDLSKGDLKLYSEINNDISNLNRIFGLGSIFYNKYSSSMYVVGGVMFDYFSQKIIFGAAQQKEISYYSTLIRNERGASILLESTSLYLKANSIWIYDIDNNHGYRGRTDDIPYNGGTLKFIDGLLVDATGYGPTSNFNTSNNFDEIIDILVESSDEIEADPIDPAG